MAAPEANRCLELGYAGLKNTYYPGSDNYKNSVNSYFSISAQIMPICVIQPTSADEVASLVARLAHATTFDFAVRSGGHTIWRGAANGLMNKTTYAGSRWYEVYESLEPHSVTVAGGRAPTVGVGGFLLGGGNTFYTGRRGWGCDNVVNFETFSGQIVNANTTENADLFKALRGVSANFGIDIWAGVIVYPPYTTQQHIDAYVEWTDNIENYQDGSTILLWSHYPTVGVSIGAAYENTTGAVAAPAFDKFFAMPNQTKSTMRKDTREDLTQELDLRIGKAQSPDEDFICPGIVQAVPTIFSRHPAEKGGNVLGLERETDNAVMFQMYLMVKGEDQHALGHERTVVLREIQKRYSIDLGGSMDWEYLDYSDSTQDPLKSYGEENVACIRTVAKKYDPTGVFQTRVPGGLKISKVA
ncbi:FAD-binding domain-containing protein [Hypomontagnella submonticulosa]|nr:FAD-binding domain-containing protein [Hypomontagnella submonticulosa]